jgi:acetyltransferase-like isoleucine patch superfamily enzyme
MRGGSVGENTDIRDGIVFHNCSNFRDLVIGDDCHIGKECFFDLRSKIVIGDNVVISMRSTFITHIDMTKSRLSNVYPATSSPIIVEDHVYIGSNVLVLMGCKIGNGALIAAGSLVIDNVNSNSLVAGVPAKIRRSHIISPD